ncbi:MAG: hypothetical protein ABI768_08460 [Acidobacteriota bacterium]
MDHLQQEIAAAFTRLMDAFVSIVPAVLVLLASLLVGVLAGLLLRGLFSLISSLARMREKPGRPLVGILRAAGVDAGAGRVTRAISFWAGITVGLAVGVNALEPGALKSTLGEVVGFLPRLLGAALLVLLGLGAAALAKRTVLLGAVNAGLPWARSGARGVHVVVLSFFVAMALDHIGVARSILVAAFSIAAGGIAFAVSLAFGLGARDLARRYLEKKLRAEAEDTGIRHV